MVSPKYLPWAAINRWNLVNPILYSEEGEEGREEEGEEEEEAKGKLPLTASVQCHKSITRLTSI